MKSKKVVYGPNAKVHVTDDKGKEKVIEKYDEKGFVKDKKVLK